MTDQTKAITPYDNLKKLMIRDDVQERFERLLGERAPQYIASVLSIVASDDKLMDCTPKSILLAAAKAAVLDLPIEPSLGMAWIIPYNRKRKIGNKWQTILEAQFQTGYKGEKVLALRSGMYQTINVEPVYNGESVTRDRLTGKLEFSGQRTGDEIIAWAGYYRLLNGYEEFVYWEVGKVHEHAKKYSQSYGNDKSAWTTNTAEMEQKTVLKRLLKSAPKSIQLQRAWADDEINAALSGAGNGQAIDENLLEGEWSELADGEDDGDPIPPDAEGEPPMSLNEKVIARAIEAGYTDNAHSGTATLKHTKLEFESEEQGVEWFRLYRENRELGADTKKAAELADEEVAK